MTTLTGATPIDPVRAIDDDPDWLGDSFVRERQGFILLIVFGLVLVPLWGIFDELLEPTLFHQFLWLRGSYFVSALLLQAAILAARDVGRLRILAALGSILCGLTVALMCVQVSTIHYFPYILGFSLTFWVIGILHTWPLRFSVCTNAGLLGSYALARGLVGVDRPVVDEVAALFYLGSTAFMSTVTVENRRRLNFRAFLAKHELGIRNGQLDATVRSLRATQTRLVEGEKLSALGRLIASLSHEINNPVNVIQNNLPPLRGYLKEVSDVLRVARAGGDVEAEWKKRDLDFVLDDAVDATKTMEMGVERIRTVHAEMRAFVRGDTPEMQPGDLNDGIRATVNMFRRSLPPDITIEVQGEALPPTLFQPGQMNQVFFNLIQNAVDAIESVGASGIIVVRSEAQAGWAEIAVEDTGPGVSTWAREHLFEPFFTTKSAGKGTGLGLATSYQIVHRHQGTIELDLAWHAGARFVVRLPLTRPVAPQASET